MKSICLRKVGFLFLFTLLCLSITAVAQKRIGILGSSTSACLGFPGGKESSTECYAPRVDNYYTNILHLTDQMRNNALSATNIYQVMPLPGRGYTPPVGRPVGQPATSISTMLEDPYWQVTTILINLPSNGYEIYTVDEVMICFRLLKQIANDNGKICFITTTQPRNDAGTFDTQANRDKLIQLKDLILAEFQEYAIDFWTGLANPDGSIKPEYDQGDHIHLNAAAHDILYNRVLAKNILFAALPLYNLNFKSEYKNEKVLLSWKNDPDNQVESFQLEKSRDGKNFNTIYDVKINSSGTYSYTDQKPEQGNNFYRLLAFFKSGKKDYSQVLKQSIRNGSFSIDRVFKSSQGVQVEWQSSTQQVYYLKLFNSMGSLVGNSEYRASPGSNRFTLLLPVISKGSYFMVLETKTGEKEVRTLMIPN